jgi:hypothetical protein
LPSKGINRGWQSVIGVGEPADIEMQMWPIRTASHTREADLLSGRYCLALRNINTAQVGVLAFKDLATRGTVAEPHNEGAGLSPRVAGKRRFKIGIDDFPSGHCQEWRAFGHWPVVAIMATPDALDALSPPRQHVRIAIASQRQRQIVIKRGAIEEIAAKGLVEQA